MPSSHILEFIGGLTFFFFGLFSINAGLQSFAGDRFKSMIARTTQSRWRSFFTGIAVTFFLQSSSAVTVMIVGLTASGLISLTQAMAVSLGAGIGTTFVVLIMAVSSIMQYGLAIITLGFLFRFAQRKFTRIMGEILFAFGFVFFGLSVMSSATAPLKSEPWIPMVFQFMEQYPFANLVIAAVITALAHSSGVILGILVSLAFTGSISFSVAVPMVLGANLGTTFTAIMASIGAKTEGKRVAWANFLLRAVAVMVIYPFLPLFTQTIEMINAFIFRILFGTGVTVQADIALCHFFFNFFVALLFLPLLPLGQKLICWLIPSNRDEEKVFGPLYLDKNALSTPSLAFAQANRELVRMGEIVQEMFRNALPLFEKYDLDCVDRIQSADHKVDLLYKEIKFYLAKLALPNMEEKEAITGMHLMSAVNELEGIGDTIELHLVRLAHQKWNKGASFSEEGWKEICEMHHATDEMIWLALAALASSNAELAYKVKSHQKYYSERSDELKMSHLKRLNLGLRESIETSAVHLEILVLFHNIHLSLVTIVRNLLQNEEKKEEK